MKDIRTPITVMKRKEKNYAGFGYIEFVYPNNVRGLKILFRIYVHKKHVPLYIYARA